MISRYCNLCGRKLTGQYFTYTSDSLPVQGRLVVCADCDAFAPRCRNCSRPMIERLAEEGICVSCLAGLRRCHACGLPAKEGIEMQDGSGRIFCRTCAGTLPPCLACGAPVDARGCIVGEGRFRCWICSTSAVDDPDQAQKLYAEVQETMAQELGMVLNIPTALVPMEPMPFQAMIETQLIADGHST